MPTIEQIEADVLYRLFRKNMWGGKHTAFEKLYKHAPSKYASDYKNAAKELIREGLIVVKPTGYGQQVSLNVRRNQEILSIIKKYFTIEI